MNDIEVEEKIMLAGSEGYWSYYDLASKLEKRFPNEDVYNLCSALGENAVSWPDGELLDIKLLVQGENEGPDWVWAVKIHNETLRETKIFIGQGGCDYTGWDCQSWFEWVTEISL